MITAYRIAQSQYIQDLSGYGAYLYGGRWNAEGVFALYLASHRSLAYLEYLIHQYDRDCWPANLKIATMEIGGDEDILGVEPSDLPDNWHDLRYNTEVQLKCSKYFSPVVSGIRVPSVVVQGEYNFVLNPKYKNYDNRVVITDIEEVNFDIRLLPDKK